MVWSSIATPLRLGAAAVLVMLGIVQLQITAATRAAAAGGSVGIFGWGTTPALESLPAGVTPIAVAAGGSGSDGYAIGSDGNLYAWGGNIDGSLGDGAGDIYTSTPVVVSLPAGVSPVAVAGGTDDGYAIGSDGNVYAWGFNGQGELGVGNDTGPALCDDGNVGQPPTNPCSTTPVKVDLPLGVTATAIATSGAPQPGAAYAIGSDGKLYAWGNGQGELGDGNENESDSPVVVRLPTGVTPTAVAGGGLNGYAIGSDGNVYAWGFNAWGELGNGTTTTSDTPVKVSLPPGVTPKAIAGGSGGGSGFAYMLGSDGNVYAWGFNGDGDLGDGTTTGPELCLNQDIEYPCSTTPAMVSLPSVVTATAISGNGGGGTAIGSDNHVYSWGSDLGNGSSGESDLPVVVSLPFESVPLSLSQGPSAGVSYAIVNAPPVAPVITTDPTSQSVYAGLSVSFSAAAGGYPAPTVQWEVSTDGGVTFSAVPGATSDTLSIAGTTLAENSDEYEAVFSNGISPDATTTAAVLTVNPDVAPAVTTNPKSQVVPYGQSATFTAAASGFPPPSVQWQVSTDGGSSFSAVSGATSDTLSIAGTTLAENANEYEAVFTNPAGSATTSAATLTVSVPAPTTTVGLPSSGANLSGGTWLDASAQSPVGIASVSYEVSGGSVSDLVVSSSSDTADGWIGAWDTTDVPNGTYTLTSVATDTEGTSATSPGVSVTVDNTALHSEVLVPSEGATLSASAVLDASASGTSDVTAVSFEVSGETLSDHVVGTAVPTLYGWIAEWDTSTVANGTYTLQSVATEVGGTTATSTGITVTVTNTG